MWCCLMLSASSWADSELFHGWSKDGTWFVYELRTDDDRVELFFCPTEPNISPTWPAMLKESPREEGALHCVRFLDPNKAPYQWKTQLVLPPHSSRAGGVALSNELSTDGEAPGFVLTSGDQKQTCYASGMREDSKVQHAWFHPSARFVAVIIDEHFHHCIIQGSKPGKAAPLKKKKKK